MSTIPVFVQTDEVSSAFFADWPIDDLDSVIPLLRGWGVIDIDGDDAPTDEAAGEFVVDEKRVIFRVSVMTR